MRNIFMESGFVSLNKKGESLCGDFHTLVNNKDTSTFVLSDGLGSGVKANILATLTAKILSTMMANNMPIEDCIYTIAKTLPVCKIRNMAYSTFTLFRMNYKDNHAYLAQFDNPKAILVRNGVSYEYQAACRIIYQKEIYESKIRLQTGDMLILLTDGVTSAGLGGLTKEGWSREDIIKFIERWYTPDISPQRMAATIAEGCSLLYQGIPQDDATVAVFKMRERQVVNMIIGAPGNKEDDDNVLKLFFLKEGKKIVCGGTTAKIVSKYLHKPLIIYPETGNDDIPPAAHIEGVDLVTEGVVTLGKVVEHARKYACNTTISCDIKNKRDGASLVAKMLFEEATDINIFIGKAVNSAHQSVAIPIDYSVKMGLIKELENILVKMNKNVKASLC